MDPIAALATPAAESAIGVVRISGEGAWEIVRKVFRAHTDPASAPRTLILGEFHYKNWLDRALCVFYKAPFSYTGEEMAELQTHGSPALLAAVLEGLLAFGARAATAGEFTKRAYLNGKIDFCAAEGVLGLIHARSEAEANAAYRLLRGKSNQGLRRAEEKLREAAAALQGSLDYPEEMEEDALRATKEGLEYAREEIRKALESSKAHYFAFGAAVALCGLPNAGKSSLLNALLREDRAIVTPIAGTTRDTLEESVDLHGFRVRLFDTAGIREGGDEVERIGVERARKAIKGADLVLFLHDGSIEESEAERLARAEAGEEKTLDVTTKGDLPAARPTKGIKISAATGEGLEELKEEIAKRLKLNPGEGGVATLRQKDCLERAARHTGEALEAFGKVGTDCLGVDVLAALSALAEATGSEVREDVVEELFRRFCVGK